MKKNILISAFACLFLFSCNENNSEENHAHDENGNHIESENTHIHKDGSIHGDHSADSIQQEQFNVSQDSAQNADDGHHTHKGADHTH